MYLYRPHNEHRLPTDTGRCSGPVPLQTVTRAFWRVVTLLLLVALHAVTAYGEIRATTLATEDHTPGLSLLPTNEAGGYATTYFTPPWNTTQALTIFASSSTQTGNLGGLEGARTLCQGLANAVPALAGTTWYPLLSDSTYDASTLTGKSSSSAPIYNIDGSVIATTRAALWSGGTLTTGVKGTETGAIRYDSVFTGTTSTGGRSTLLCGNWTSTSGNGTIGATNVTSSGWIGGLITSCAVSYRLFCIGNYDPYQVAPSPTPSATVSPTPIHTNTRTPTPTITSTPTLTRTATSTPTPGNSPAPPAFTSTPTPPPQGSIQPTPATASVRVQVLIGATPVPAFPVKIGAEIINTDLNGHASTTVSSSTFLSIETGLAAIAFTPRTGYAGSFHDRTLMIDATRLVIPSPEICSVLVQGVPHLWFPYSNIGGTSFQIPLSWHRLNRILSPSGLAAPAAIFPSGGSGLGFSLPRSHFESGAALSGTWEFLATSVSVPAAPPQCADSGAPAQPTPTPLPSCASVDLSVLFTETKRTIANLSEASLKAAARREWKPKGSIREPFLQGGARALNKMLNTKKQMGNNPLSCAVPPASANCTAKALDKATIKKDFTLLFPKHLPPGLGRVKRLIPAETSRFGRMIDALPSTLYSCP
jgi:hypothetical protein